MTSDYLLSIVQIVGLNRLTCILVQEFDVGKFCWNVLNPRRQDSSVFHQICPSMIHSLK